MKNFGISTASFFGKLATEDALIELRRLGVDIAEVFLGSSSEYRKDFVSKLVSCKGNMTIHSVHALGLQFEPELMSISERVRDDAQRVFRAVLRAGRALGAKYYTFHGPAKLKNQKSTLDLGRLSDNLNRIIANASKYGLGLSYETVHWCHYSYPDFFYKLREACPGLYATLDVKQCLQAGFDPVDFLDAIGDRLSTVHLCDLDNDGNTCLPGRGIYDFGKLFVELNRRGLGHVPCLVEVYSKDYDSFDELGNAVKRLRLA